MVSHAGKLPDFFIPKQKIFLLKACNGSQAFSEYINRRKGGRDFLQEKDWIRRIQKRGSKRDADKLIHAYYDEIYRYAWRQIGDKETAMDLTQEIFIAVLQSIRRFDSTKAAFRTWLYRIATNKIIDYRRRAKPVQIPLETCILASVDDFTAQMESRDLLDCIEKFVSGLPLEQRQVFYLRVYGGYTFPQIADRLAEPETAVKARYYRLTAQLRKEFLDEK